jgi:hypothetical protein
MFSHVNFKCLDREELRVLAVQRSPEPDAVIAMIVARVLEPRAKLATAGELHANTLSGTLGELLGLSEGNEELLYSAMDWLLPSRDQIERALAQRHLAEGTLALWSCQEFCV